MRRRDEKPLPQSPMLVPCDADAPRSCSVETGGGCWYQRSWKSGERDEYKAKVLMKPAPFRSR